MNIFRIIRPADMFSLLNGLFGFGAILAASRGSTGICILLVMLSAAADGIDGFLARKMKSSVLGPGLDCLADLVSFGVAPAILAVANLEISLLSISFGAIYMICGTLRLARFNISEKNDNFFEGFPITASGVAVAASMLLERSEITLILMLILAALMVSSIPYPKIRDARLATALVLVFLIAASIVWLTGDSALSGALILIVMAVYMASPVVIAYLQSER